MIHLSPLSLSLSLGRERSCLIGPFNAPRPRYRPPSPITHRDGSSSRVIIPRRLDAGQGLKVPARTRNAVAIADRFALGQGGKNRCRVTPRVGEHKRRRYRTANENSLRKFFTVFTLRCVQSRKRSSPIFRREETARPTGQKAAPRSITDAKTAPQRIAAAERQLCITLGRVFCPGSNELTLDYARCIIP